MSSTPVPGERELQQGSTMPPPSKIARLRPNPSPEAVDMAAAAAPSPTTLGLGLTLGAAPATETASGKTVFTFMQLQELEHQALIYEYIVAGIPVPLHLVFPIWKSVAAAAACDGDNHHYPSILGCGGLCLDYLRNSLEPEPGRCRRTDGKKWRCSRDVVPDQKYCDRHLHRGRSRLKKPAEATAATGVFQELMPAVRYPGPDSGGIKGQLFTAFGTGSGFN